MPEIIFNGQSYACGSDANLLESLGRQGVKLSYGCRGGMCHACKLKAVRGAPTAMSQKGLKPTLRDKGYFLPCMCWPEEDMELALPDRRDEMHVARIGGIIWRNDSVLQLNCLRPEAFRYRPGQFVTLMRAADSLARSYSLASLPSDEYITFHIRILPDGRFSRWLADEASVGEELLLSEAMGACCYLPEYQQQPLLLAGTGTGLAPLYGVLLDALAQQHARPIHLIHGARDLSGLYMHQQLLQLAETHDQFSYTPCIMQGGASAGIHIGVIDEVVADVIRNHTGWQCYLCGGSHSVHVMRRRCLAAGVDSGNIHTDSFG